MTISDEFYFVPKMDFAKGSFHPFYFHLFSSFLSPLPPPFLPSLFSFLPSFIPSLLLSSILYSNDTHTILCTALNTGSPMRPYTHSSSSS